MTSIAQLQKNEITEYEIYKRLAKSEKSPKNKRILEQISKDELSHYNTWKTYTKRDIKPSKFKILKYSLISKILGITFAIKLMERGEEKAQENYKKQKNTRKIVEDEAGHEKKLANLVDEERLKYVGSIVLGLNDALVEITGSLAGFTLALQDNQLVTITGLVMGSAAALSMAASEYISKKTEQGNTSPIKSSIYTGITYLMAVTLLILPFLLSNNVYTALGFAVLNALILIGAFSYYLAIVRDMSFIKKFMEMAPITMGVALVTFGIGLAMRILFNIEV